MADTSWRLPLITIVVSIRNAAVDLAESLENFSAQTFTNFEVLIADCNSTDNPAQHLNGRAFPIVHAVQADTGIYDAWNKVLPRARGTWVVFMGAGDTFKTPTTLAEVVKELELLPEDVLMAYGKVDVIGENGSLVRECGAPWGEALNQIKRFDMFPHQAAFQRVETFDRYGPFDPSYRIAGDSDMILRLAAIREPVHFPLTVANFRYGGTSSMPAKRLSTVREMSRVMKAHKVETAARWVYAKALVLDLLHRMLSEAVLYRLIDGYRFMTGRKRRYRS